MKDLGRRARTSPLRRFAVVAALSFAGVALYVAWTTFRFGGDTVAIAVTDLGQAAAALFAAGACALTARRRAGRARIAWGLLAASAASWGAGEIIWSYNEVGRGIQVPFPSIADAGFLAALPLAAAGILSLPSAPVNAANRLRAVLDGAVAASSLFFILWTLGIGKVFLSIHGAYLANALAFVYPAGDVAIISLLVVGIRGRTGSLRAPVMLLLEAVACLAVADGSFAFLTLSGTNAPLGSQLYGGWVVGYVLFGLAALWPAGVDTAEDRPVQAWQLAIPWVGVLGVMAVLGWITFTGGVLDPVGTGIGAGMGLTFLASQALVLRDSVRLVHVSRLAEARLAERTNLLDRVIDNAPLGIARVSSDLRLIDANPTLGAILHAPQRMLVGASVAEFLATEEAGRVAAGFEGLANGSGDTVVDEGLVRRADGSSVWLRWSLTPIRDARGRFEYFVAMLEDLTLKHQTEVAAAANTAELARISKLKSEFMSMVSHEFRTALTGIQGYSELMCTDDVTPEEVKEFSRDINGDALRLNRMITEMLDLDRIESGRITMQLAPLDLTPILRDAVEHAQITTSKHAICAELDPALPLIQGDSDRLIQVVTNLLSNAMKYSPQGGEIVVRSSCEGGQVRVDVIDHGQGIPPEFINKIFGRYERYEGKGAAKIVGTGLGLAITQQIVQLHQGRIWVDSVFGQGSQFHFTIPAMAPVAAVVGEREAASPATVS